MHPSGQTQPRCELLGSALSAFPRSEKLCEQVSSSRSELEGGLTAPRLSFWSTGYAGDPTELPWGSPNLGPGWGTLECPALRLQLRQGGLEAEPPTKEIHSQKTREPIASKAQTPHGQQLLGRHF